MPHGNYSKAAYHKTLTYFTAWNIYTTSSTVNTTFSLLVIRCKSVVQYDLISHVRHLHVLKITYFMSSGGWVVEVSRPFSAQLPLYQRRKVRGGELSSYLVKEG